MFDIVLYSDCLRLNTEKVHYITWAQDSTLSFGYNEILNNFKLTKNELSLIMQTVNAQNETACLTPIPVTILPHCSYVEDSIVYKHFNDAIKAHNQYVQKEYIIWDMRGYHYCGSKSGNGYYEGLTGYTEYIDMMKHAHSTSSIFDKENKSHWIILLPFDFDKVYDVKYWTHKKLIKQPDYYSPLNIFM